MPHFGTQFSGTDPLKLANGTSHDAGVRGHRNHFDFAVFGGVNDYLVLARIGQGNVIDSFKLETTVNLAGLNFTIGIAGTPAKYQAAFAGGAANSVLILQPPVALGLAQIDAEEIRLIPNGALPVAGLLRTTVYTTKR